MKITVTLYQQKDEMWSWCISGQNWFSIMMIEPAYATQQEAREAVLVELNRMTGSGEHTILWVAETREKA